MVSGRERGPAGETPAEASAGVESASESSGSVPRLLVATDLGEQGLVALRAAARLARRARGDVYVLHVVGSADVADALATASLDEAVERLTEERQERLRDHIGAAGEGLRVFPIVEFAQSGDVAGAIARLAADLGADLVAVASHRAVGMRGGLMGSVTQRLLRSSPCPVLVVRPSSSGE